MDTKQIILTIAAIVGICLFLYGLLNKNSNGSNGSPGIIITGSSGIMLMFTPLFPPVALVAISSVMGYISGANIRKLCQN